MKSFTTGKAMILDQEITEHLIATLESCQQSLDKMRELFVETKKQADGNTLFGINEACAYLGGISNETLLYYRRTGLPYYKKGRGSVWYRKGDIDEWLEAGRVRRQSKRK